jgi:hypothetical protein
VKNAIKNKKSVIEPLLSKKTLNKTLSTLTLPPTTSPTQKEQHRQRATSAHKPKLPYTLIQKTHNDNYPHTGKSTHTLKGSPNIAQTPPSPTP